MLNIELISRRFPNLPTVSTKADMFENWPLKIENYFIRFLLYCLVIGHWSLVIWYIAPVAQLDRAAAF